VILVKFEIGSIRELWGGAVTFTERRTGAGEAGLGYSFTGPLQIQGSVVNIGDGLLLKLQLDFSVQGACSRCLEPVTREFSAEATEQIPLDEVELEDSGIQIHGNQLDISRFIENQLTLALPIQLLCESGCQGLCAICGRNLNHDSCECSPEPFNPEFEKLRSLLTPKGGGTNGESNQ
jgi:uncharacterized protein